MQVAAGRTCAATGNHNASGDYIICDATICGTKEKVVSHTCKNAQPERQALATTMHLEILPHAMPPFVAPMGIELHVLMIIIAGNNLLMICIVMR